MPMLCKLAKDAKEGNLEENLKELKGVKHKVIMADKNSASSTGMCIYIRTFENQSSICIILSLLNNGSPGINLFIFVDFFALFGEKSKQKQRSSSS